MLQEQKTNGYVLVENSFVANLSKEERTELCRKGFNRIIDENMIAYTSVMERVDDSYEYTPQGWLQRLKDWLFADGVKVYPEYVRVLNYVKAVSQVADVDDSFAAEFLVCYGADSTDGYRPDGLDDLLDVFNEEVAMDCEVEVVEEQFEDGSGDVPG